MSTRGRPRQFDADQVLDKAMRLFWAQGYTGTSLDELTKATGLTRPSLYNAFGNKQTIYRKTFERFADIMQTRAGNALLGEANVEFALVAFYDAVLDIYFESGVAQGCFIYCTATTEVHTHPEIRVDLKQLIEQVDQLIVARIEQGVANGQISEASNPQLLGKLAQAILHSLAIRARAGESKSALKMFARESVSVLLRF